MVLISGKNTNFSSTGLNVRIDLLVIKFYRTLQTFNGLFIECHKYLANLLFIMVQLSYLNRRRSSDHRGINCSFIFVNIGRRDDSVHH